MIRGRTRHGPVPLTDESVVVSLTEFTARRFRDLPGIARAGIGLSRAWWAMPGAIGVTLYVDPLRRRGGSLSVWKSEQDLRRFVALPRHVAIMRRYRDRVTVRAATWTTGHFSAATVWEEREAQLTA
jgi:heme-degrading monooxygenase HmoA